MHIAPSIKYKIFLAFTILMAVYVLYASYIIGRLQIVSTRLDITDELTEVNLSHELVHSIESLDRSLSSYTSVRFATYLKEAEGHLDDIDRMYMEHAQLLAGDSLDRISNPQTLVLISEQREEIQSLRRLILEISTTSGSVSDLNSSVLFAFDGIDRLRETQIVIAQQRGQYMEIGNARDVALVERFKLCLIAAGALLLVLSCLFSMLVCRSFVHRLNIVADAAKKISEGDLDVPIEIKGGDEISRLAASIDLMRKKLLEKGTKKKKS